jgi:hypothetical protein
MTREYLISAGLTEEEAEIFIEAWDTEKEN